MGKSKKAGLNRREFLKLSGSGSILALAASAIPGGAFAAPAGVKGPVKVGYQAILSGALAGYGEFHKMGATMAVEEINAKGGIAGQKLEFEMRDSTTKPEEAIKNARYFVDSWGADFLAGIDSSGQCLALAPLMEQLDKVMIITHGATEKLTEEWVYKKGVKQIFRNCMPVYNDGNAAAIIAKDFPAMNWANLSPKYEYGFTCWKMFQEALSRMKPGTTFKTEAYSPFGSTNDFRPYINTIMDARPDGLFSVVWGGELVTLIKQAKEAGLFEKVKYVMLPVGASMDVLEGCGKEMPDNLWISGRYFFRYPDTAANKAFVDSFHKKYSRYPAYVSETAYSSIYAFKQAVEKAGSKDTKAVIQAMEGMVQESPGGRRVFRKEDHQAMYSVPWGPTGSDPKYPIKIMKTMTALPPEQYFARPPFEGPKSFPPFST